MFEEILGLFCNKAGVVGWLLPLYLWEGRDQCALSSRGLVKCSLAPLVQTLTLHSPILENYISVKGRVIPLASTAPRLSQRPLEEDPSSCSPPCATFSFTSCGDFKLPECLMVSYNLKNMHLQQEPCVG